VRAGLENCDVTGAVVPPLHLSSTYAFRGFGDKRKYDYSRSGNRRATCFRKRWRISKAAPAPSSRVRAWARSRWSVICCPWARASSRRTIATAARSACSRPGTSAPNSRWDFVDFNDTKAVDAALSKPAGLVWIETPSNPLLRITDIADIAKRGHAQGAHRRRRQHVPVTGLAAPLELGADIVVHSTTKYINGHSDVVGGAVIAKTRNWPNSWLVGQLPGLTGRRSTASSRCAAAHAARAAARTRPQCAGRGRVSSRSRRT
jgi:cystathionine gamma-synthase